MAFITDPDNLNQATEVVINTGLRTIQLLAAGNLNDAGSTAADNGVTGQALYSWLKEEWKTDALLIPHPFPMVAITPEQFEFVDDWEPADATSRNFIRSAGWSEVDSSSVLKRQSTGVVSLGSFEDAVNDNAYFQFGNDPTDTAAAVTATFPGVLNEAVETYSEVGIPTTGTWASTSTFTRASGSFITDGYKIGGQVTIRAATTSANDGTYVLTNVEALTLTVTGTPWTASGADATAVLAVDNRNAFSVFLRVRDGDTNGKTFSKSDLTSIGLTTLTNKAERYPLSNATDLKIAETDANVSTISPYTDIEIRYFDQAFTRDVDTTGSGRNFGIVIDVGTHSGVDGSMTAAGSILTTAEGGVDLVNYDGGILTVHEGTNKGQYRLESDITSATAIGIVVDGTLTPGTATFAATTSNDSFTLQRTSTVTATAEEIYEKIQWSLRQATDVDETDQVVTGKTGDELLRFVGDTLETGVSIPTNANGGGSGVVIEGFDSNDTNRITFTDNSATQRTFPFVAAGTITFNTNITTDTSPAYWMFFQHTISDTVADLATTASATNTTTFTGAATLPVLVATDYINVSGFTNEVNNGIWQVTGTPTTSAVAATKVNGDTVVDEGPVAGVVSQDPINSPDAIIVNDNGGTPINGVVSGATVAFDFDYDGNVQGGRTAATDALIIIRAIGLEAAQFVETTGTITRATGLGFSLVAALERNYENP